MPIVLQISLQSLWSIFKMFYFKFKTFRTSAEMASISAAFSDFNHFNAATTFAALFLALDFIRTRFTHQALHSDQLSYYSRSIFIVQCFVSP